MHEYAYLIKIKEKNLIEEFHSAVADGNKNTQLDEWTVRCMEKKLRKKNK